MQESGRLETRDAPGHDYSCPDAMGAVRCADGDVQ